MWLPLQSSWLICLVIVLLAGCGNKKEGGGTAPASVTPARAESLPAPSTTTSGASQQLRNLAILPEEPTANDLLHAVFKGDSGRVNYRWEKDGQILDGEELDRLAVNHLTKGAVITVIVENAGVSYSDSVVIGNLPPVVQQVSFKNPAIHRGVDIELVANGEDADGDDVTFAYKWFRSGTPIDSIDGPSLPGDQFNRGDEISFQVIPFDGVDEGAPYVGTAITIPNAPPRFVSNPPLNFLSETYSYQARAEDFDNDEVIYSLENPPPGMKIDRNTGDINWPLAELPPGEYRINIVADDSQGQKGYQEYSLTMSRQ